MNPLEESGNSRPGESQGIVWRDKREDNELRSVSVLTGEGASREAKPMKMSFPPLGSVLFPKGHTPLTHTYTLFNRWYMGLASLACVCLFSNDYCS